MHVVVVVEEGRKRARREEHENKRKNTLQAPLSSAASLPSTEDHRAIVGLSSESNSSNPTLLLENGYKLEV